MTDAGERLLRERIVNHPYYPPNDLDDTYDIVCAELERAAGIAENATLTPEQKAAFVGQPDDPDEILRGVAAAIRKLKE